MFCSLSVIFLAGTAGWQEGQRLVERTATARQRDYVRSECANFAEDIREERPEFMERRIELLASLTPAVPCLATIPPTATALALRLTADNLPTVLPTALPTATAPPLATTLPTTNPNPPSSSTPDTKDHSAIDMHLEAARAAVVAEDWQKALDDLELVRAIDDSYARNTLNALMLLALRRRANEHFIAGQLAEAILLVNRAETFGLEDNDPLRFERTVANYYLNALHWRDINPSRAIQYLELLLDYAPNYPPFSQEKAVTILANQRVAYGDQLLAGQDPCAAQTQYQTAQNLGFASAEINAKMTEAEQACAIGVVGDEG